MAASKRRHVKNSWSLDIRSKFDAVPTISENESFTTESTLTTQAASALRETILDLLKSGDINDDEQIDFDAFKSVLTQFLPNISENKLRTVFDQWDSNGDGNISYTEFFDEDNFNQFLQECGHFASNSNSNPFGIDPFGDNSNLNQHDKQIMRYQKDTIAKLVDWIQTVGKPAEEEVVKLQSENEELQSKHQHSTVELEEMKNEVTQSMEERNRLQLELLNVRSKNMTLSATVDAEHHALEDVTHQLEEYGAKDTEIEGLVDEIEKMKREMKALKEENRGLKSNNMRFEERNKKLTEQRDHNEEDYGAIQSEVKEFQNMIHKLQDQLEMAQETMAEKDEEIENMQQKLQLVNNGSTQDFLDRQYSDIAHMSKERTLKVMANQQSFTSALSYGNSGGHFRGDSQKGSMAFSPRNTLTFVHHEMSPTPHDRAISIDGNPFVYSSNTPPPNSNSAVNSPYTPGLSTPVPGGFAMESSTLREVPIEESNQEEWMEEMEKELQQLKDKVLDKDNEIETLKERLEVEGREHQATKKRMNAIQKRHSELSMDTDDAKVNETGYAGFAAITTGSAVTDDDTVPLLAGNSEGRREKSVRRINKPITADQQAGNCICLGARLF